jgi:hypothetical protein
VRIAFDDLPKDFRMIAGRTATVSIIADGDGHGDAHPAGAAQ